MPRMKLALQPIDETRITNFKIINSYFQNTPWPAQTFYKNNNKKEKDKYMQLIARGKTLVIEEKRVGCIESGKIT